MKGEIMKRVLQLTKLLGAVHLFFVCIGILIFLANPSTEFEFNLVFVVLAVLVQFIPDSMFKEKNDR